MNDYEKACERFNRISGSYEQIKRTAAGVIEWADDEYEAAQDNLRQYESQPGVPLPQYRQPTGAGGNADAEADRIISGHAGTIAGIPFAPMAT